MLFFLLPGPGFAAEAPALTVGYLERILLEPGHIKIKAKIDTGAKTSSLGVDKLEWFERDGLSWVRFHFVPPHGEPVVMERRVVRVMRVRHAGCASESRPVVELDLCLGDLPLHAEVNLATRKGMNYPMLLGRRLLEHRVAVVPGAKFLTKPTCTATTQP